MVKKFRKPINESYCILNEKEAEQFKIEHEKLEVTRVKGSAKWKDLVVDDNILKFPMVGCDDHWIVLTLENFCNYIDQKTEAPIIELKKEELEELSKNGTRLAHTLSGDEVLLIVK